MKAVRRDGAAQRDVHHARLDDRESILRVDRKDAIEAIEPDQHDAVGERAAGQAGARAARHERRCRSLASSTTTAITSSRVPGKTASAGLLEVRRQRVGRVREQLARPEQHAPLADDCGEARGERLIDLRPAAASVTNESYDDARRGG